MAIENTPAEGKAAKSPQEAKNVTPTSASGKPKKERKIVEVKNDLPPVWKPAQEGDTLEGFYIGARVINYRNKPFLTHIIQDEETGEVSSFSGAIADRKMMRLPKGSWCRVTYKGELRTNGGFDAADYGLSTEEHVRLLDEADANAMAREMLANAKAS